MIRVEGYIGKKIFDKDDFKIYAFYPTNETIGNVSVHPKYKNISISGVLPNLLEGVKYRVGLEVSDGKYSNSYKVVEFANDEPKDDKYKHKLLETVVTPKQYKTLIEAYPNIVDMIINNEDIDVDKLKGIGDKTLSKIKDKVQNDYVLVDLVGKYHDLGMTMNGMKKLYDTYKSVELIDEKMKENPYNTITKLAGLGFKKTDVFLLKKYPYLIDSKDRCLACVNYLVKENENNGNTWISMPNLYRQTVENVPEAINHFYDVLKEPSLYYNPESNRVALFKTYKCERDVSEMLLYFNSKHDKYNIDYSKYTHVDGFELSEEQRQILKNVCENNLNLLIGWAGTGKTFSTKALINMFEDNNISYVLMSPTGKSSKVLSENTGRNATTIHRGLGYSPRCGFTYNAKNKLEADVVIIDEYSMIDVFLLKSLLSAIKNTAKIIFIGDDAQLPSVSAGNISTDMLESEVIPVSALTQVFRYKGKGLSYVATQTREGNYYFENNGKIQVFGVDKDYIFVNANKLEVIPSLQTLYQKLLNKGASINDIVILTSYNKGEFGTNKINKIIQEMVNPSSVLTEEVTIKIKEEDVTFRENDRVMQVKNNYEVKTQSGRPFQVMNGDVGTIKSIQDDEIIIDFDDELCIYTKEQLKQLLLAYSISIHKSQGMSIPYAILITPEAHTFFLNKNLLYVAITRARKLVYHIGTTALVRKSLRKSENKKRDTFLCEMLRDEI